MGRLFIVLCIMYGKAIHCSSQRVWEGCSFFFALCMGRVFVVLCIMCRKGIHCSCSLHHLWEGYSWFFASCVGKVFIVLCILYGKGIHCSLHPVWEGLFFASCVERVRQVIAGWTHRGRELINWDPVWWAAMRLCRHQFRIETSSHTNRRNRWCFLSSTFSSTEC